MVPVGLDDGDDVGIADFNITALNELLTYSDDDDDDADARLVLPASVWRILLKEVTSDDDDRAVDNVCFIV